VLALVAILFLLNLKGIFRYTHMARM